MSDRGEAAGQTRGSAAHGEGVQPNSRAPDDLGVPEALPDITRDIAPAMGEKTADQRENLERLAADRELRDELASVGFTGPKYQAFENELARYSMSVLCAWMHTGYVFQLTSRRGLALHPTVEELEDLHWKPEMREELAVMTVAQALPRFHEHALVGGGWRPEGGASLATYFMGTCLYIFPNEFRKRRVQQQKWQRQDCGDPAVNETQVCIITDPGLVVTGNMRVRESLAHADPREAAIVALTVDGYSQEEIVELLGETSVRAVEGVLYRWRAKEQQRLSEGGV